MAALKCFDMRKNESQLYSKTKEGISSIEWLRALPPKLLTTIAFSVALYLKVNKR